MIESHFGGTRQGQKKQENIGIALLRHKGSMTNDSKEKANILNDQFKYVFKNSTSTTLENSTIDRGFNITTLKIGEQGVLKLLKDIHPSKAMGPDQIPNIVQKTCAKSLAPGMTKIFQKSIDCGELPDDWLNANATPVYKKGDAHKAENYRPVSLTSVTCKLLEHIICKYILTHLEKYNILTSLNHGFRSGYSCETQLIVTLNNLLQSYDQNKQTDVVILDFSKAFDTVPHDKLMYKLEKYGIKGDLHKWLTSFLTKIEMRVVTEGEQSNKAVVESGVPQGTVLGLLLFLCHINDLPECVKSQVRLFTDDFLFYYQKKNGEDHILLQNDLTCLEEWAQK